MVLVIRRILGDGLPFTCLMMCSSGLMMEFGRNISWANRGSWDG
jgi:hypothetical protein